MDRASLIAQIHDAPVMAVIVVTGGGAQAIADILAVPGASRTLLEALVPYSEKSLAEFLGSSPGQAVSAETAAASRPSSVSTRNGATRGRFSPSDRARVYSHARH